MKNIVFTLFLALSCLCAIAQQLPQFTQFANNSELFNPSAIGIGNQSVVSFGGRWQMLGFGSEPRSLFAQGYHHMKSSKKQERNPGLRIDNDTTNHETIAQTFFSHSIGGQVFLDQYGAFGRTSIAGLYSLAFNLNEDWNASVGMRFGFSNFSFNSDKAQVLNVIDPTVSYQGGDQEYDNFTASSIRRNSLDLGLGITLQNKNFLLGFALNQLTKSLFDLPNSSSYFDQKIHWNLMTGYTYSIPDLIDIKAMLLVKKMAPSPTSLELSLQALLPNDLWAGLHFRNRSSIGLMGGFLINNKFQLGYSIDFSTNRIRTISNGGHELILSYRFGE